MYPLVENPIEHLLLIHTTQCLVPFPSSTIIRRGTQIEWEEDSARKSLLVSLPSLYLSLMRTLFFQLFPLKLFHDSEHSRYTVLPIFVIELAWIIGLKRNEMCRVAKDNTEDSFYPRHNYLQLQSGGSSMELRVKNSSTGLQR